MFMSAHAHAAVKGYVGVAKVLPYILNMLVRPVDQLAMPRLGIGPDVWGGGVQNDS